MATPTYTLEYAATAGPLEASPTWTTISSDDIISVAITWGRQSETDRSTQPSAMTVRLDNRSRTYDPAENSNLKPSRQVRLTATHNAVDYVLFRGVVNIEGWQQVDYQHPATSSCVIVCLDLLGHVAQRANQYPLFEQRLLQLGQAKDIYANGYNSVLRHWPLDDSSSDSKAGTQTFFDGLLNATNSVNDYRTATDTAGTQVYPSEVYTSTPVRPLRAGALDGWAGGTGLGSNYATGNYSGTNIDKWARGLSLKLRSLPAEDRVHLLAGLTPTAGWGWFLNRDGTLTVCIDGSTDYDSTNAMVPGGTYHITATWDGSAGGSLGVLNVYVNGEVWITQSAVTTTTTGSLGVTAYIGAFNNYPRMDVLFNDVWVLASQTLTAAEVADLYDLWLGTDGNLTGKAAGVLCDAIGLPHSISSTKGRIGVRHVSSTTPNIANLLQDLERTERGRIYYDHRSEEVAMVFWRDLVFAGTRHTTVQLKLSDDPAETGTFVRYSNPEVVTLAPITTAIVTTPDGTADWVDLDARDTYGEQSLSYSTLSSTAWDGFSLAASEIWRNSDPTTAVRSLTITPTSATDYTRALDLELFDLVELTRKPHDTGTQQTVNCLVEGITCSIGAGDTDWSLQLFLTRVSDTTVGVWGTAEFYDPDQSEGVVEA